MLAVDGKKTCSSCRNTLPLLEFYKNCVTADGLQNVCKACKKRTHRNWKYCLQSGQLDSMLIKQRGLCAICSTDMGVPQIDHCHATGKLRSLLCRKCNSLLGMCNDKTEVLTSAIAYIGMWREAHADQLAEE